MRMILKPLPYPKILPYNKAMGLFEILLLSVGLAMDAFAVSVCKGLAAGKASVKEYLLCGSL